MPEILVLFREAETYRESGGLPEDSKIRELAHQIFYPVNALQLTAVCNEIYRQLAIEAVTYFKRQSQV
jgi:hypothetical protein